MPGRILIIDDDEGFARALSRNLKREGHDVSTVSTAAEARTSFEAIEPDVVILDYQLPDTDGLSLLDELAPRAAGAAMVMVTAYPNVDVAVQAMRRGAFDFLAKDLELRESMVRIERAVEVALLRRRMAEASRSALGGETIDQVLLGESPAIRALKHRLRALSGSDETTVLVAGETGTGKGVVARAIHAMSGRAYEPLVAVDCNTIPATLVESELFGHERGAFSGATNTKLGRVEAAGRGTLFLDEIGDLDLSIQAKLLRLIEEREFTRVGSTRTRRLEARIITATNRNLEKAVAEGRFRADLRYRLEVFVVDLPPLRERTDDIFLFTAHFAAERARALGKPEPRLNADVIAALPQYPFPGNVRELRNMVEQAVLLAEREELSLAEFPVLQRAAAGWQPPPIRTPVPQMPPKHYAPWDGAAPPAVRMDGADPRPASERSAALRRQRSTTLPPPGHFDGRANPASVVPPPSLESIRRTSADRERASLVDALEATRGNVAAAARRLGVSRYKFLRRLRKHGMR